MSFSGFGGAGESTDKEEENRRGFVDLWSKSSASGESDVEGGLVSFLHKRVSAPPWGWSLVTGEPRDSLCIVQGRRPTREKSCFAFIDLFSSGFLIRELFVCCRLLEG